MKMEMELESASYPPVVQQLQLKNLTWQGTKILLHSRVSIWQFWMQFTGTGFV